MVLKALAAGMNRTISSRGVLLPLYLSNLALSVVLALIFFHTLSAAFGDSRASLALLSGFDSSIVGDLRQMVPDLFPDYFRMVGIGSLFYVLLNTFLAGGVISALQTGSLAPARVMSAFGDATQEADEFLKEVKGVQVGVYKIHNIEESNSFKFSNKVDKCLIEKGWEPFVHVRKRNKVNFCVTLVITDLNDQVLPHRNSTIGGLPLVLVISFRLSLILISFQIRSVIFRTSSPVA